MINNAYQEPNGYCVYVFSLFFPPQSEVQNMKKAPWISALRRRFSNNTWLNNLTNVPDDKEDEMTNFASYV